MNEEQAETRYHIDLDWYKQRNKSFEALGQSRMCASCQRKLGTEVEERVPSVDKKSGRVVFEQRKVPFGSNPFAVFRDCCGKQKDFVTASTPLLEAVFRLFLANGNQPLTADDILQSLEEWAAYTQHGRYISPQLITRVVENDDHYGVRPVAIPQTA